MGSLNNSIQVLGYRIIYTGLHENDKFNGFQLYAIDRNQQWDEYKNFWGKISDGYYIWCIPYMMSGRINMIAWDLFIEDSFGKSDIPIRHLAKFSNFLETNFTWDIPEIKFEEYEGN